MTVIIDPKELEHILIFLSLTVTFITMCYLAKNFLDNNK